MQAPTMQTPLALERYQPQRQQQSAADSGSHLKLSRPVVVQRMNCLSILGGFLVPCAVFIVTTSVLSFGMRYTNSALSWAIVGQEAILVLWCLYLAWAAYRKYKANHADVVPNWYIFLAATVSFAWVAGIVHGSTIYGSYMKAYYDITNLNSYYAVDISKAPGGLLMDAGRVNFDDAAHVDLERYASFTDKDTYCVAPIVGANELVSYDFWVVGMDCCGDTEMERSPSNFDCGDVSNPYAKSGLRLMDDDKRAGYTYAVQSAVAQFGITAKSPLFFEWVEDPLEQLNKDAANGLQFHLFGIFGFIGFQLLLVISFAAMYWKTWGS